MSSFGSSIEEMTQKKLVYTDIGHRYKRIMYGGSEMLFCLKCLSYPSGQKTGISHRKLLTNIFRNAHIFQHGGTMFTISDLCPRDEETLNGWSVEQTELLNVAQ